jgi:hypothetical protein
MLEDRGGHSSTLKMEAAYTSKMLVASAVFAKTKNILYGAFVNATVAHETGNVGGENFCCILG